MHNFREIAERFDAADAWRRTRDAVELGRVFAEWIGNPTAAQALGDRGKALVEAERGALARTQGLLAPALAACATVSASTAS
jgi:3-deoxy-D-manno-octulosonic-acid transferase